VSESLGSRPAQQGGGDLTSHGLRRIDHLAVALAPAAALCLGFLLTRSALLALLMAGGVALAGVVALADRLTLAGASLGVLPWFVIFADLMPPLVKTFTSAGAVLAVLWLVSPVRIERPALKAGVVLFLAALIVALVIAREGNQFIQAAKYLLFPAMAVALVSPRAPFELRKLTKPLLASGMLAVSTHIAIIVVGAGAVGTKYGVGERLGYSSSSAHDLALMSMIVATGGLATASRNRTRLACLCLGTIPALATGVRSAFVASVAVVLVFVVMSRFSIRSIALVATASLVLLASGAFGIAETRYRLDQSRGEFASLSTAGSGRGSIWTTSLQHWAQSGPPTWAWGSGLRSIEKLELERTGSVVVGHSDVIEVLVQLGIVGFAGWLLIWLSLFRARLTSLVLVPLAVYAVVNGSIEYVDSLVFGLALAAACAGRRTALEEGAAALRRVRGLRRDTA
jgi:O-antigen ligase